MNLNVINSVQTFIEEMISINDGMKIHVLYFSNDVKIATCQDWESSQKAKKLLDTFFTTKSYGLTDFQVLSNEICSLLKPERNSCALFAIFTDKKDS